MEFNITLQNNRHIICRLEWYHNLFCIRNEYFAHAFHQAEHSHFWRIKYKKSPKTVLSNFFVALYPLIILLKWQNHTHDSYRLYIRWPFCSFALIPKEKTFNIILRALENNSLQNKAENKGNRLSNDSITELITNEVVQVCSVTDILCPNKCFHV